MAVKVFYSMRPCGTVEKLAHQHPKVKAGNAKGGSIIVPLTTDLNSLD